MRTKEKEKNVSTGYNSTFSTHCCIGTGYKTHQRVLPSDHIFGLVDDGRWRAHDVAVHVAAPSYRAPANLHYTLVCDARGAYVSARQASDAKRIG